VAGRGGRRGRRGEHLSGPSLLLFTRPHAGSP
jgi:hypothetical protein